MIKVSCLCPTYNRPPGKRVLVEEALESFLRQDYPARELIVLNDTPGQTLTFDHPLVRIVNTPFRCANLGAKRNLLAALATGELLCPWDDDDISLPWRLSRLVDLLGEADYYNPRRYWFLDGARLHHDHSMGYAVNASIYRKTSYQAVGGTPNISMGDDAAIDVRLCARSVADHHPLRLAEWFYIYRWSVSPIHLSSIPGDTSWATIGRQPVARGDFRLDPHWEQDYVALTRTHVAATSRSRTA